MRLLYIIGNGFDLNLGLNTKYKDFYNFYSNVECKNEIILQLKNSISQDYSNWSDLELGFGKYTKEIKNHVEFDIIYEDLVTNLSEFLSQEQSQIINNLRGEFIDKFYSDLVTPFKYLPETNKRRIKSEINNKYGSNDTIIIDFIIFNYTQTVEEILKHIDESNNSFKIGEIVHIHGEIGRNIILGVNDREQIENNDFHGIIDIEEQIIKESHNLGLAYNTNDQCRQLIANADLLCIYGSSIGETDKIWWDYIGSYIINSNLHTIIYTIGAKHANAVEVRYNRIRRNLQSKFLDSDSILENFHVGINTDMFKIET